MPVKEIPPPLTRIVHLGILRPLPTYPAQIDATEGISVDSQQSVLIVDSSEETREVLQTALQRRGVRTFSAGQVQQGIELAREHHPDLIVLDLELDDAGPAADGGPLAERFRTEEAPLVLLGRIRGPKVHHDEEIVAKPYHYGPLIRKIEELLLLGNPSRAVAVRNSRE
jgi:CheY-like chemotaxis protein